MLPPDSTPGLMSGPAPTPDEILALWHAAFPSHPVHPAGLRARLDASDPQLWLRLDGQLVGWAALRSVAGQERGHLRALLVHPEQQGRGVGAGLLAEAEHRLRQAGHRTIVPGAEHLHFFPGVPAQAAAYFERRGYQFDGDVSHDLALLPAELPAARLPASMHLQPATSPDLVQQAQAFAASFSARWGSDLGRIADQNPLQILTLLDGGQLIGFALTGTEDDPAILPSCLYPGGLRAAQGLPDTARTGGLGPFGIAEARRGEGLGWGFFLACAAHLRERGVQVMGVDWTRLPDFYLRAGGRIWSSWHHVHRAL
ncbi:GNAT family N-acetyltransferase [Deinococcus sonorensis]|uniref:GNAT family N-acetyltransferase n=2 Tax=Deinococcus sonorensis TaxID=309891 RepID=A0AAU7UFS8_9DEIO